MSGQLAFIRFNITHAFARKAEDTMMSMVHDHGKYGSFDIAATEGGLWVATRKIGDEEIAVPLTRCANGASFQGWWGERPTRVHTAITGVCLWGCNWVVEFEPLARNGKPARKSLALPYSRDEAYERLHKGQRATTLYVPREPSAYHWRLISWIAETLKEFDPARVLMHVPGPEYHGYHAEFERRLGHGVSEGHESLDRFVKRIMEMIMDAIPSWLFSRITFVNPFRLGVTDSVDSYVLPYAAPERFGVTDLATLVGVEDMVEVRLAYEARARTGRMIPILCGVLKEEGEANSPYLDNSLRDFEVDAIDL